MAEWIWVSRRGRTSTHRRAGLEQSRRKEGGIEDLKKQLLELEIRRERAEAEAAELRLDKLRAKELDRLAGAGACRELAITAPIVPEVTPLYVASIDRWRRREPGQPLTIYIDSPGGSAIDGFHIFEAIRRLQATGSKVETIGTGEVASMGAILLQAGDHRVMDQSCLMLVHKVSGHLKGTEDQMDDQRKMMDILQARALDILTERSTLSRDDIDAKWRRADWYLNPEQALAAGFIDEIR